MLISNVTSPTTQTGEVVPPSPAPVVQEHTALPTVPNATNWRKRWIAIWLQAATAQGAGSDE